MATSSAVQIKHQRHVIRWRCGQRAARALVAITRRVSAVRALLMTAFSSAFADLRSRRFSRGRELPTILTDCGISRCAIRGLHQHGVSGA